MLALQYMIPHLWGFSPTSWSRMGLGLSQLEKVAGRRKPQQREQNRERICTYSCKSLCRSPYLRAHPQCAPIHEHYWWYHERNHQTLSIISLSIAGCPTRYLAVRLEARIARQQRQPHRSATIKNLNQHKMYSKTVTSGWSLSLTVALRVRISWNRIS